MRQLMFGWEFPPHISGGLGTACYHLILALAQAGQDIVLVLPRVAVAESGRKQAPHVKLISASDVSNSTEFQTGSLSGKFEIREIDSLLGPYDTEEGYHQKKLHLQYSQNDLPQGESIFNFLGDYGHNLLEEVVRYGMAAEVVARRERFDIIHSHDWMTVLAGIRAKRASGKPLVHHVHSLEFDRSGEDVNKNIYDIECYGLEAADHVVAVSGYTKKMLAQRYGIHPDKVTVVHNAVPQMPGTIATPERKSRKIVLFLGRITFQKGPDYFIDAAAQVLKAVPGILFVMAGTGDMIQRMIMKVAQLGIGKHFHFTGFLKEADAERLYAMSDLYVMPSISEPFGITPLEAIRQNVPVIISRQSGVAEILQSAIKVNFWDTRSLAEKMIAILRYPALVKDLRTAHREELKKVKWIDAAHRLISIYRHLTGKACG